MLPKNLIGCGHGGCLQKVDPARLNLILSNVYGVTPAAEDANVLEWLDGLLLQTTDFQNPVLNDPFDAGEVAGTNALSDIFAVGGQPVVAHALMMLPDDEYTVELGTALLKGLAFACASANCKIVGGHTTLGRDTMIGLSVVGRVDKANLRGKAGARPGDTILLTKPVGAGIAIAAKKQGAYSEAEFTEVKRSMASLNSSGTRLGTFAGVHACTDVTGFGLLGHAIEIGEQSDVILSIDGARVPTFARIHACVHEGILPELAERTHAANLRKVSFSNGAELADELVFMAPETSGGLLVCVDPEYVREVVHALSSEFGVMVHEIGVVESRPHGQEIYAAVRWN